jgi:glycosyltransferase involved in cell wall biosynthesis
LRSAILSTFPPRACGIGVFSSDLRAALLEARGIDDVGLVVVVDEPSSPQQPDVLATVSQSSRGDYVRAARLLGRLDVDVVLLQHEYGIYGGAEGEYVLSFARELSQPLVVSLHTLLSEPAPHQLEVLTALCREAERVVVMTETARRLLIELDACPAEKIRIVPHGVPALLGERRAEHAAGRRPVYVTPGKGGYERMQSRFLLSTFGLLSAGKGLETALEALPAIVERHPDVLYMIVGRTHPQVARREGEKYRLQLERQVLDLGLEGHVAFDDRFLSIDELADLLAATDVFVTPYRNREQIASGALTFALAAGCAAVSTPYWYAEEVLATGAGTTVPFGDPDALADAVCDYIEQPELLAAAQAEARRIGSELRWSSVAEATADVLREAAAAAPMRAPIPSVDLRLDHPRTDHLHTLVDDVGIVQHAYGVIPNWSSGYCVDDVARLALVALELERRDDPPSRPRVPPFRGRRRRERHAQLPQLRAALARRPARRGSCRPVDLGARRDPLDRLGAGSGRPGGQVADLARDLAGQQGLAPNRRVRDPRSRAARPRPARRRLTSTARATRGRARGRLRPRVLRHLALVRGRPHVRQRPPPPGADRRWPGARPRGGRGGGARVAQLAR